MEYTINNSNGLSVSLSKIESDEIMFVASVHTDSYQYGVSSETEQCEFFEPTGGPRISVGTNLQEYNKDLPNANISYIGAGKNIIVIKAVEPEEEQPETEQESGQTE
jgi:hypothetical protein